MIHQDESFYEKKDVSRTRQNKYEKLPALSSTCQKQKHAVCYMLNCICGCHNIEGKLKGVEDHEKNL